MLQGRTAYREFLAGMEQPPQVNKPGSTPTRIAQRRELRVTEAGGLVTTGMLKRAKKNVLRLTPIECPICYPHDMDPKGVKRKTGEPASFLVREQRGHNRALSMPRRRRGHVSP